MKKEMIVIGVIFFILGWTSCGYVIYSDMFKNMTYAASSLKVGK